MAAARAADASGAADEPRSVGPKHKAAPDSLVEAPLQAGGPRPGQIRGGRGRGHIKSESLPELMPVVPELPSAEQGGDWLVQGARMRKWLTRRIGQLEREIASAHEVNNKQAATCGTVRRARGAL